MTIDMIQSAAAKEGFSLVGVTPATTPAGYPDLLQWIDDGYAADMHYFANRRDAYQNPESILSGVNSLIMLAYPYPAPEKTPAFKNNAADASHHDDQHGDSKISIPNNHLSGLVARYASTGEDYHEVLHPKLKRLCSIIENQYPESKTRGIVDTAPLMEREFANLAGLGWIGKNTLLLNKYHGSYFFLACVLTTLSFESSTPHETAHCGSCTACLDACPTDAFPEPGRLDASRCISYLTIEHRDAVPLELREKMGHWLFGCDICQEVCPWNRKPTKRWETQQREILNRESDNTITLTQGNDPPPRATVKVPETHTLMAPPMNLASINLSQLFDMDDEAFRRVFRKTPLWRPRRRGILRNAAIVLGNQRDPDAIPALSLGLKDREPLVRGASAWALGQIHHHSIKSLLETQQQEETDQQVWSEIDLALRKSL